jgi:hypothetical protein
MYTHFTEPIWPTKTDYERAFTNWQKTIQDAQLRQGTLVEGKTSILQQARLDNHACLYRIDDWMVRCFCRTEEGEPPKDIEKRYELFSTFCSRNFSRVSALVPLNYISNGINVEYFEEGTWTSFKEEIRPIVKMPFVAGLSLGTFVVAHHRNGRLMTQLCDAWVRMIGELEAVNMAHGDLDLTNVLVQSDAATLPLQLKLIDYDNTWIPDFKYYRRPEFGHRHFQHPAFYGKEDAYNAEMDHFAALVIYISLKALSVAPELYDEYEANDEACLLFTASDYEAERRHSAGHIRQLLARHVPGLEGYLDELCESLHSERMPRSLSIIARQTASHRVNVELPEETIRRHFPSLEPDYEEVVWTDWDNIEYFHPDPVQQSPAPAAFSPLMEQIEESWQLPSSSYSSAKPQSVPPSPYSSAKPQPEPLSPYPSAKPQQPLVVGSPDSSQSYNDPTLATHKYTEYPQTQGVPYIRPVNSSSTRSIIVGLSVVIVILLLVLLALLVVTHH